MQKITMMEYERRINLLKEEYEQKRADILKDL